VGELIFRGRFFYDGASKRKKRENDEIEGKEASLGVSLKGVFGKEGLAWNGKNQRGYL